MRQYVYRKNVVKQLLVDRKKVYQVFVMEEAKERELIERIKEQGIRVNKVDKRKLDQLSERGNHQGVVAEIDAYRYYSLAEITATSKGKYPLLVMLDGIEDPHNLGAILRTCDAVNVDGVIIKKHHSVELNATVAKVSTGAIEHVAVCKVTNLVRTLDQLKDQGYWVVGADMENAQNYRQADYSVPLVLVIGSEGSGISNLVKRTCDYFVSLPMVGNVSSLNASVACGVLLYEVYSKRSGDKIHGETNK